MMRKRKVVLRSMPSQNQPSSTAPSSRFNLFKKYLIYYILILILPILVMGFGMSAFTYKLRANEVENHSENFAYMMRNSFDNTFASIYAFNESLVGDRMYDLDTNHQFYLAYLKRNHLKNVKTVLPFLENIVLLNPDEEYIFSSNGTYTPSTFYSGQIYQTDVDLKALADGAAPPPLFELYAGKDNPCLCYALDPGRSHAGGVNLYIIPHSYFDALFKHSTLGGSRIVIQNLEGELLYQYGGCVSAESFNANTDNGVILIDGSLYLKRSLSSSSAPLIYSVLTPLSSALQQVSLLLITLLVCLVLTVLLGVALSYHLAKKTSTPIHSLSAMLQEQLPPLAETPAAKDELEDICHAVTWMHQSLDNLNQVIASASDDVIYVSIMKLLTGEITSLDEMNRLLEQKNIHLDHRFYTVAVFDCGSVSSHKQKMPALTYKELLWDEQKGQVFVLNSYDTPYLYVLISTEEICVRISEYLQQMKDQLFRTFAVDITLGISGENFYFSEIGSHFNNALLALDYEFTHGKGHVLDFRRIQGLNNIQCEKLDYKKLYQLLLSDNKQDVILYISQYHMNIANQGCHDIQRIKVEVFGIFNFLYETFPHLVSAYQQSGSSLLTNCETAEDFLNYACDLCVYIWENLQKSSSSDKFAQISEFIQQSFYKDNFSIQLVADQFNMSMSSLSKYYKAVAGVNISEVVNQLKIERATDLLVNTDLTINQIVLQVGYSNTSSFIRKFKEQMGVTPGKYREIHKK